MIATARDPLSVLNGRLKGLSSTEYSYKLQGGNSYGMDVAFADNLAVDEKRMSLWVPYADGKRRDGVGDLMEIAGIKTERHRKNPIVGFDHFKDVKLPIGLACEWDEAADKYDRTKYINIIDPIENQARVNCFFYRGKGMLGVDRKDEYDHAVYCAQLFHMAATGMIGAGSIGYQVVKALELRPDYETGTPQGLHLLVTNMLEASLVILPANQDTAAKALAMPKIAGHAPSPYLVKCLCAFAPEKKVQFGYTPELDPKPDNTKPDPTRPYLTTPELTGSDVIIGKTDTKSVPVPHGDMSRTDVPPAKWKPGLGAEKNEGGESSPPSPARANLTLPEHTSTYHTASMDKDMVDARKVKEIRKKYRKAQKDFLGNIEDAVRAFREQGDSGVYQVYQRMSQRDRVDFDDYVAEISLPLASETFSPTQRFVRYIRLRASGKAQEPLKRFIVHVNGKYHSTEFARNAAEAIAVVRAKLNDPGAKVETTESKSPQSGKSLEDDAARVLGIPVSELVRFEHYSDAEWERYLRGVVSSRARENRAERERLNSHRQRQEYLRRKKREGKGLKTPKTRAGVHGPLEHEINVGDRVIARHLISLARRSIDSPFGTFAYVGDRLYVVALRPGDVEGVVVRNEQGQQQSVVLSALRKSMEAETKSLKNIRMKYRATKGIRRCLKRSSPGSSVLHVRGKDVAEAKEQATKKGLKFERLKTHDDGTEKIKLTGDDAAMDDVVKHFGVRVKSLTAGNKAMDEDLDPTADVTEDTIPEEEMQEEVQEKWGAQMMRRAHEDHSVLMKDYDDLMNVLEDEDIHKHFSGHMGNMEKFLSDTESLWEKKYKDHGYQPLVAEEDKGLDDAVEADSGPMDESDPDEADSGPLDEPSPDEAVEGMETAEEKALRNKQVKQIRGRYRRKSTCPGCGKANCSCKKRLRKDMTQDEAAEIGGELESVQEDIAEQTDDTEKGLPSEHYATVGEAGGYLKEISDPTSEFTDEHRMKAYHYAKTLDGISQVEEMATGGKGLPPRGIPVSEQIRHMIREVERVNPGHASIASAQAFLRGGGSSYSNEDFDVLQALISATNSWNLPKKSVKSDETFDDETEGKELSEEGHKSEIPGDLDHMQEEMQEPEHQTKAWHKACKNASGFCKELSQVTPDTFGDEHRTKAAEHAEALAALTDNPVEVGELDEKSLKEIALTQRVAIKKMQEKLAALIR